ncbi:membrane protein, LysE superfamily [Syntrophotalea carbinolica DSM 2380]|uniref:Membrane protein, LysE superfamily n=1 Tax=Syntrophotalea carbinolica (strain DSM 2380 / NBRC 103641 / GraBd1) TaxID=338963 RepID=Q3A633_SYNC1|nr:LysE family transporter [Syntrophotalea carbinolica]ABA88174.1 membrane protein, LysE superfamily [Syntrophotalea carbinolica DSM 2380]
MFLSELITVLVVGWFVVVTPGPNMAIVIKNSIFHSRSHGVFTAVGLLLGNIVHISYCLAGIGLLISQSMFAFNLIKWLGAGYLVYLGIRALKSNKQEIVERIDIASRANYWVSMRSGFFTDLLNPKATLFYLALFTQIIRPDTPAWARVTYGISIAFLEFLCFVVLSMIIGHSLVVKRFEKISHLIERFTGLVLVGLGIRVAFSD